MADLLDMPKSSTYRYVRLLKEHGYLIEHYTGKYKLGYKFLEFANIVKSDINITEVSYPFMNDLTLEFGETTILSVISDIHAVCLATYTSNHAIKVSSEEGKILPLHGGASSKILLAYQSKDLLDKLFQGGYIKKFTDNTITEREKLVEELNLIKKNGYAFSSSEVDEGVVSYGFPLRDSKGRVLASLAIAGPEQRMKEKDEEILIAKFKDAIEKIEYFL